MRIFVHRIFAFHLLIRLIPKLFELSKKWSYFSGLLLQLVLPNRVAVDRKRSADNFFLSISAGTDW